MSSAQPSSGVAPAGGRPGALRFLIIDEAVDYRRLLRYHLDVQWPNALVDEVRPSPQGELPPTLDVCGYDLVLLGHPLGHEQGFAWLERLRAVPGCPPIVVFADPSDEFAAVDALKAGAASYFPKSRVTHQRLVQTIRDELRALTRPQSAHSFVGKIRRGTANNYAFLKPLHSSELAAVYLARADNEDGLLACKVLRCVPDAGNDGLFDRFLQEYEIIAKIDHPNVVRIFDLGIADDHAYIAMEYLSAGSLAARLTAPLEAQRALDYTRQVAGALRAIHEAGVLHRDLKPGNIMFREDDSLALIDFGLAKHMELESAITGAGQIFGTPFYMSPEQGHAEPTDARSDLYSLGCILHEMLTGKRPFVGSSAMSVIYKHAHAPRPRLPMELTRLQSPLERMLAIRPDERYQSAAELLGDIADL